MSYKLQNIEIERNQHPKTFSIPRSEQRNNRKVGDFVKLIFEVTPPKNGVEAERMWVKVTSSNNKEYTGILDNDPAYVSGLASGAEIHFKPENICAIYIGDDESRKIDPGKFAIVSKKVTEGGAWPKVLHRHKNTADPSHSGWVIFSGDESDDFIKDINNMVPVRQQKLLEMYPVLDSVLDEPDQQKWKWDDTHLEYRRDES